MVHILPEEAREMISCERCGYTRGVPMTIANLLDPANRAQVRDTMPDLLSSARANPQDQNAILQFAVATIVLGEAELAAQALGELIGHAPQNGSLAAHYAQALANIGKYEESLKAFEHALALNPQSHEVHVSYGMALLRLGEFGKAWEHYEHRDAMPNVSQFKLGPTNLPRYSGGNLGGQTILLLAEQGIGDTIMMARYADLLARRSGKVMIAAHQELADLLRFTPGVWRVVSPGQSLPARFDTHARLFTLPRLFGATAWNIPHDVPYLKANPARVEHWRKRFAADGEAGTKRVGLVWAGNPSHLNDAMRSMHLNEAAPLAEVKDVIFYSLQKGERENEAQSPPSGMRMIHLTPEVKDFSDLAAIIDALDLLITVDTAPAHLAGALAKPVWTLLPFVPDWRWMLDRSDSPWYPTMRLFRQPKLHDWASVITNVRDELNKWVKT